MKNRIILTTLLIIMSILLSSCSPRINAYDFEDVGLDTPELEEGEKAIWVKISPIYSFMTNVAFYGGAEEFASFEDIAPYGDDTPSTIKYKKETYIFDTSGKVKNSTEKEILNLTYEAIFSPNEFLSKHLKKDFETKQITLL